MEVFFRDTIEFTQVPFGLIPEIFNAVDGVSFASKKLGLIDAIMFKLRHI
jgi:hypothetical protein